MRNKYLTILVLSLLLIANVIATFIIGYDAGVRHSEPINTSDTVYNTRIDTIYNDTVIEKTKYIPKEVIKLRTDTITKDTILTFEQRYTKILYATTRIQSY